MTVKQRTGLWVLLGAVALAMVTTWLIQRKSAPTVARVPWDHPLVERDLDAIEQDTLRVLVMHDPLCWEERPAAITGFAFEVLERFARQVGVPMKVLVMADRDSLFMALQRGHGDVIAAQYTPARWERKWFATTAPLYTVKPMLARLRGEGKGQAEMMEADSVVISAWSPFRSGPGEKPLLKHLLVSPTPPDELLMNVVIGNVKACVISDATAAHEATRFPALEFVQVDGKERPICLATRTNAPRLLETLDTWLAAPDEERLRKVLLDGYLGRMTKPGSLRKRSMPAVADSISPYDAEFRKHGQGFGWKWQLLTAMAWKESRFDSTATSVKGAQGIMQFMPRTATHFGLDTALSVGDHIRAAKLYITRLDTIWMRAVPDRNERLRFVLASYNAGVGHIIDAQRLAEHLGLDPQCWEQNVERAVLLLAKPQYYMRPEMKNGYCKGSQVFHYVRDIVSLYDQLAGLKGSTVKPAPVLKEEVPPVEEAGPNEADGELIP